MHKLLERQLKKHLPDHIDMKDIDELLKVVNESYVHYDKSRDRQDRAMFISSAELVSGNEKLRADSKEQRNLLIKLKQIMKKLQPNSDSQEIDKVKNTELVDELSSLVENQLSHEKEMHVVMNDLMVANKELDSFAHIISHDLKAPLRGISSIATWLYEDYHQKLDQIGIDKIQLLLQRTKKMYNLIGGILEFTKIGKSLEEDEKINLNRLLKNDIIPLLIIPTHVDVKILDLPEILGGKLLVHQLFQNLIDNAIKFCDHESGKIEIRCDDHVTHWEFCVQDNGVGIEGKYHDKIFEIFQTLGKSGSGTGIGLTIAKKIVNNYGGKIRVESTKKSTTFCFTWPK